MASASLTEQEARTKVLDLIHDTKIAMLASLGPDGGWHSRPMATAKETTDGDLWFLADAHSEKVADLRIDNEVLLTYANESNNSYVAITGTASIVQDPAKVEELWSTGAKAWFPNGPQDPNIALIRVEIASAEYWDVPSATMVALIGFAKSITKGGPLKNVGENRKVNFQ